MKKTIYLCVAFFGLWACKSADENENKQLSDSNITKTDSVKIPVLFDTDANNELDDQHALAYLFFNEAVFDVVGITVNATTSGGEIMKHYEEAERIMKLCDVANKYPLHAGANGNFSNIVANIDQEDFDGKAAVDFIINEARKVRKEKLVLLPVGKLTNIALALAIAPDIKQKVKIVWLGANYPKSGEYNLVADIPAMNYVLEQDVPFEMVTVRYGEPSGTDAVKVTPEEIKNTMTGLGPKVAPISGRHGGSFSTFGDYSVSLFENIDLHGNPPSRALFDMVAVAILKNPTWGERKEIPCPRMVEETWQEQPNNLRKIAIWENFDKQAILDDFYDIMKKSGS